MMNRSLIALLLLLLVPSGAYAQASITGVVRDTSGGVLPGVTVVAVNVGTGVTQQTLTGASGDWRLAALPTGTYEVVFELDGFKKLVRSGISVEAAVTRSVPVRLEIGGLTEEIRVTADAASA